MPICSFCDSDKDTTTPVCEDCGSLRYPVVSNDTAVAISRQEKLKMSATVAATLVTPGSFVVIAILGAAKLLQK